MFVKVGKQMTLSLEQKRIIAQGEWLNDLHMDHFNSLLESYSDYRPVETWRVQLMDTIQPILKNKKHIQILHTNLCGGHWICSYYDTKNIFIYDSLNSKRLHEREKQFLTKLFPTYDFITYSVQFPTVQQQPNAIDCGVFAIAFAVSLLFNIKPDKVRYDLNLMRPHLIKMFESNVIEHFPQDLIYDVSQKVPLVVRIKGTEIIQKCINGQYEKKQEMNQLQKIDGFQQIKEGLMTII